MDAEAFRTARRTLGLTEIGFGNAFGVSRRTVQYWAKKGPPPYVGHLLELALVLRIPAPSKRPTVEDAFTKLAPALDAVLEAAVAATWDKEEVFLAVERWVREKGAPRR